MAASRFHRLRALAFGGALAACAALPAVGREAPRLDARHGALLIHGNFCGPGNRGPGHRPVDALDRACAHHDACSPSVTSGRRPKCACNRRLHVEAGRVARNPRTSRSVRETARFIAQGALRLPCN